MHGARNEAQVGSAGGGAVPLREVGHASGCGPRNEKSPLKIGRTPRELKRRVTGRDVPPRCWRKGWEHASDGWCTTRPEQYDAKTDEHAVLVHEEHGPSVFARTGGRAAEVPQ